MKPTCLHRSATASVLAVAVLAAGCSDLGDPVEPAARASCSVAPAALDFGEVAAGSSAELPIVVTNDGDVPLQETLELDCAGFSLVGGGSLDLAPGASHTLVVRFSPSTSGPHGCSWDPGLGCDPVLLSGNGGQAVPSFAAEIQPLFNESCTGASCHDANAPAAQLDLTEGASYGNLVDVVSRGYAPALRVARSNPSGSVLWNKVANTTNFGGRMPPGGRFGAAKVDLIRAWIAGGAPAN